MIRLSHIGKTYRVVRRREGLSGAVRSLFVREYREIPALTDVSFEIPAGALVGCIGPNGAGKSTAVKLMSGILVPDAGECEVMGYVPWRDRAKYVANIGVVFGQRTQLWWDVPVRDSYALLRDIYRVPDADFSRRLSRYAEALDLNALLDVPLRQLSLGQRMRCELCGSLLHAPKLLFLDEPTIGLDAVSKQAVRAFVRELNRAEGVTVLLTTHDTADLEALTERILLLGHGRLLFDGPLSALRARCDTHKTLTVRYAGPAPAALPPDAAVLERGEGYFVLRVPPDAVARTITQLAAALSLTDVQVSEMPVDEVIASIYRELRI
ncbi:MAG: ATP-binding cassette domain-containing protein [Eubacteriales bacterium]|nr:ATP-binding cassette domain-containing protein [Eubacteriales bacterium]